MKWFLTGVCAVLTASSLWADQAADLFNQAAGDVARGDFKAAAPLFDEIIKDYPSTQNIDEVWLNSGIAHLHLNEYDKAVASLFKETADNAPAEYRGAALYFTGYAQLLKGGKATGTDKTQALAQAVDTMTRLIKYITTTPTADNQDYLELAMYNRALTYLYQDDIANSEKDVNDLLQKFPASLQKPDYLLLLGNLYARDAAESMSAKKGNDVVTAAADKAKQAFDEAINDPNARVQANDARLAKAEVLYLVAGLDPQNSDGYAKALDAFREVQRKADLIPTEQAALDALRAANTADIQRSGGKAVNNARNEVIEREAGRLDALKNDPDPIIQALIRMAQCYNSMTEGNEARTILHRLAKATLTPDQQQQVDLALINSYVLANQPAKADQALTTYLGKHVGDPAAQGVSVEIGNVLMKRGDFQGALDQAKRSLKDFPNGNYVDEATQLEVEALGNLGQRDEQKAVADAFLSQHPDSPVAVAIAFSIAQQKAALGDLAGALDSYKTVRDTAKSKDLQAAGAAGYIQTLQSLQRIDDVITETKAFATNFPDSPELPNILVMQGVAMDEKHDPAAIGVLQDEARKFPEDTPTSPSPFALFYIVNSYQRSGQVPQMIQAAEDLKKAFPTRYALLMQAADAVSSAYVKEKKFDLAVALYQSLADAPQPDIASVATGKIGDVWVAAAKAMGHYQSMQDPAPRAEAEKRIGTAESTFVGVLKKFPTQLEAVDNAFRGLEDVLNLRHSWGLLKPADFDAYLTKATADLTDPEMQTRVELAKAGLVFNDKKGAAHYPEALARFKAATAANPNLRLTRLEATRFGELLLAAKDYPTALQVYTTLQKSDPKDPQIQADANYGIGATYLAQGDLAHAREYFLKMKSATWHPHINDVKFALAFSQEQSDQASPSDLEEAKQTYADLMQSPQASVDLQAKAMLGYGRVLEKQGHPINPATPGTQESAIHYYQQVDTIYGPAAPEVSAEGLYDVGQAYDKAGDKANALKAYQTIEANYKTSAPDWYDKAVAAASKDQ